jgi:adenylate cyclase
LYADYVENGKTELSMKNPLISIMDGWISHIALPEPTDPFERAFAREVMEGERLRMKLLAAFFCFAFIALYLLSLLSSEPYLKRMIAPVGLVTGIGLLYEMSARALIRRILSSQRQMPRFVRYGNAFLETSLPTLLMMVLSSMFEPVYVLTGPPFNLVIQH